MWDESLEEFLDVGICIQKENEKLNRMRDKLMSLDSYRDERGRLVSGWVNMPQKEEKDEFVTIYKSKPIRGIVLELQTLRK